ncbi:MAG TPA: nitrous oxide reductase accessory protein NosL [Myxococcales bacterium]|jgi:copper chaperone NosL|nr:nitrous oxide reductase accessory protein NosL [Myxococcales bacterium]
MKIALSLIAMALAGLLLWRPAPAVGPEPIRYGRDACDHCRMHFAGKGFAAERRDETGALRKYDDIGCMLVAASHGASRDAWIEDHATGNFVPLLNATFVRGGDVSTPMNSGIVGFANAIEAAAFARAHGARVVALEGLLRGTEEDRR